MRATPKVVREAKLLALGQPSGSSDGCESVDWSCRHESRTEFHPSLRVDGRLLPPSHHGVRNGAVGTI